MHLEEAFGFTLGDLQNAVEDGLVTARSHNTYPYTIYNYGDVVQFSRAWDEVTLSCRGLILDHQGNVIARPWKKFFNLGEQANGIQYDDPVEVMDKMDGSLGILYQTRHQSVGAEFAIATRGSFHSEQAEHATNLFRKKYWQLEKTLWQPGVSDYTYLFEIIFRDNRIVLDYGDLDDLVLLGAVGKRTGYYYGPREAAAFMGWPGPVVPVFDHKTISDALGDTERANAEGFVIRSHNTLVKVKQPDYIELHRLRFNMTPKRIWEALAEGKNLQQIVEPLPDEFQDDILGIGAALEDQFSKVNLEIAEDWSKVQHLQHPDQRKEFAIAAQGLKHRAAMFNLFDGRTESLRKYMWAQVKPKSD